MMVDNDDGTNVRGFRPKNNDWIPVDTRLPDKGEFLVLFGHDFEDSSIVIGTYVKEKTIKATIAHSLVLYDKDNDHFWVGEGWWVNPTGLEDEVKAFIYDVTHWMPLPKLPKSVERKRCCNIVCEDCLRVQNQRRIKNDKQTQRAEKTTTKKGDSESCHGHISYEGLDKVYPFANTEFYGDPKIYPGYFRHKMISPSKSSFGLPKSSGVSDFSCGWMY